MATVGSFGSRAEAQLAASMLEARGLRAEVLGDDAGGVAPHFNLAVRGGYALLVPDEDRETANALLTGAPGSITQQDGSPYPVAGRAAAALLGGLIVLAVVWQAVT